MSPRRDASKGFNLSCINDEFDTALHDAAVDLQLVGPSIWGWVPPLGSGSSFLSVGRCACVFNGGLVFRSLQRKAASYDFWSPRRCRILAVESTPGGDVGRSGGGTKLFLVLSWLIQRVGAVGALRGLYRSFCNLFGLKPDFRRHRNSTGGPISSASLRSSHILFGWNPDFI